MLKLSWLVLAVYLVSGRMVEPSFKPQTIDDQISIGYGLAIGDVNGDGKPDILLADRKQFVWYRNGDWKRFVMVENLTESDNVCIAARDIDGDGKVEVAVGAQWNPGETADTLKSGSVHYLIRPADPTQRWIPVELHHEPTIHRMRWVRNSPTTFQLIVAPLHGRGNKGGEGKGVRILAYDVPKDPKMEWKYSVVDDSMHMTHNFDVVDMAHAGEAIWVASKEGIRTFVSVGGHWSRFGQSRGIEKPGFGEVRKVGSGIAGISPMHGNELRFYPSKGDPIVLASNFNQGHALAALTPGQIVAGWREPNNEKKVGIKLFVRDAVNGAWKDYWVDENGMACEDLQVADLNGDGQKDIIAAGRATHNLKIYWNQSGK